MVGVEVTGTIVSVDSGVELVDVNSRRRWWWL